MRAIILAAGLASRLRPITDDRPKCMVEVHGREILDRALEALGSQGVSEAVIVTGYCRDRLREAYGSGRHGVALSWLENEIFDRTNNLYSLWLAREHMAQDHLLLEADILFEASTVKRLLGGGLPNAAVVDDYRPELDGTVVKAAADGRVTEMVLKANQGADFDHSDSLKTVNIYRFSQSFMVDHYLPRLDHYVKQERTDVYYEAVLAELVGEGAVALQAVPTGEDRWAEVDTPGDLELAGRIFPPG